MSLKIAASGGWRPIEDAPKDGTWIVGYRGDTRQEPVYVVMRWWDGVMPEDDDDFSCDEVGEWVGPDGVDERGVTHWMTFDPHPNAPPKTTAMNDYFGPGREPTRAERGIAQSEIDEARAVYAEYERTGEIPAEWLADHDAPVGAA